MNILSLDLGTKTGWAHSCGQSGVWDFKIYRDESGGMRLIRLRSKLKELYGVVGMDLVVFEAVRHAAPKMQGPLVFQAEMQGVVKFWCMENDVNFRGYSPTEIKKYATGKGNTSKAVMLNTARAKWPKMTIIDDNHADALFLLDMVMEWLKC